MSNVDISNQSDFEHAKVRVYHPRANSISRVSRQDAIVFGAIPASLLESRKAFIDQSREGIPGAWVKSVIDETGLRDVFLSILGVTSSNLSRVYRRKSLGREISEEVLDTVRLIDQAMEVWESKELAMQWLSSPVPALGGECPRDLFDTFEGRRWVSQVLNKIEHGDFS